MCTTRGRSGCLMIVGASFCKALCQTSLGPSSRSLVIAATRRCRIVRNITTRNKMWSQLRKLWWITWPFPKFHLLRHESGCQWIRLRLLTAGSSFNQPWNLMESAGSSFLSGSSFTGFISHSFALGSIMQLMCRHWSVFHSMLDVVLNINLWTAREATEESFYYLSQKICETDERLAVSIQIYIQTSCRTPNVRRP